MKNFLFALGASLIMLFVSANTLKSQSNDNCCGNCSGGDCCKEMTCCTSAGTAMECKDMSCGNSYSKPESGSVSEDPKKDAVTGETIPEGKAIEFSYLGKPYYFSSEDNLAKFKAEPIDYVKDLMCPVQNEGASKEYYTEYNGAKYYVCCPPCLKKINKSPEKYLMGKKDGQEGHEHK